MRPCRQRPVYLSGLVFRAFLEIHPDNYILSLRVYQKSTSYPSLSLCYPQKSVNLIFRKRQMVFQSASLAMQPWSACTCCCLWGPRKWNPEVWKHSFLGVDSFFILFNHRSSQTPAVSPGAWGSEGFLERRMPGVSPRSLRGPRTFQRYC